MMTKRTNKQTLVRNSLSGVTQVVLTAILSLISVPIFIKYLGIELYGVFAIVSIIGNLNIISTLGLNSGILVVLAKNKKSQESDYTVAVTVIFQFIMVSIVSLFVIFFRFGIVTHIFSVPVKYVGEASTLLIFLILANSVLVIGNTFTAVIDSQQKIHITNICQFIYSSIYWGGLIMIVVLGGSLVTVGLSIFLSALIWFLIVLVAYYRIWKDLHLNGLSDNWKRIFKFQLSYGIKVFLSGFSSFLFEPVSKLLLSHYIGLNAVAFFAIAVRVRDQLMRIVSKSLYPLYPYIASASNEKSLHVHIFDLYKKIQLFMIPLVISFFFISKILVTLWIGHNSHIDEIATFVNILSVTLLLLSPPVIPLYQYLLVHKPLASMNMQISAAIINVIVFYITYKAMGLYAILASNTIAYITAYIVSNYYHVKLLQVEIHYLLKEIWRMTLLFVILLVPCFVLQNIILSTNYDLMIYPIVVFILFIFGVRKLRIIQVEDIDTYLSKSIKKSLISKLLIASK